MNLVVPEAIRMAKPVELNTYLSQQINPALAFNIGKLDVLASVASSSDVIQPAGDFDS